MNLKNVWQKQKNLDILKNAYQWKGPYGTPHEIFGAMHVDILNRVHVTILFLVDDCVRIFISSGADSVSVGNQMLYHIPEEFFHSFLFLPAGKTHTLKLRDTGRNDLIACRDLLNSFIEGNFPAGRLR
jgi:hypothetical protein